MVRLPGRKEAPALEILVVGIRADPIIVREGQVDQPSNVVRTRFRRRVDDDAVEAIVLGGSSEAHDVDLLEGVETEGRLGLSRLRTVDDHAVDGILNALIRSAVRRVAATVSA